MSVEKKFSISLNFTINKYNLTSHSFSFHLNNTCQIKFIFSIKIIHAEFTHVLLLAE